MHQKHLLGLITWLAGAAVYAQSHPTGPPSGSAAPASAPPPPPAIVFASEAHDFGKLAEGVAVRHDFIFTNTSAATITIDQVEPDCHCTTATNWSVVVGAGKTGIIPIQYQSRGYNGPIDQTVKVFCNGAPEPVTVLHMKGLIWQAIEVNPVQVAFNLGLEQKTNSIRSLRIRSWEGEMFLTAPPESGHKAFQAEVRTNIPGKDYYVDIRTTGKLNPGKIESAITLKTSSTNLPVISIPVTATVAAGVTVMPLAITLPPGPLTKAMTVQVSLRNNYSPPIAVKSASTTHPEIGVEAKEIQPGRLFYLTVRFPVGIKLTPGQDLKILISTTSPEFPELKVPVSQMGFAAVADATRPH